jgi:endonuclease/exonuclease/phosphatase family metal-dependent hydrolase
MTGLFPSDVADWHCIFRKPGAREDGRVKPGHDEWTGAGQDGGWVKPGHDGGLVKPGHDGGWVKPCMLRIVLFLSLSVLLPRLGVATELKLSTWNLEWLTDRQAGDRELPADAHPKQPADIDLLQQYATQLDADVIAIEEVDGPIVAARVFTRDKYSIHMSRDHVVQRVGIVVRRGIHYDVNPDVTTLDVGPRHALRSGVDITLTLEPAPLRILAVHLKTGCFDRPLNKEPHGACEELEEQRTALIDWIKARQADGIAFVIMGDFNRHMDGKDQFWSALQRAAPLMRATEGHSSPCWGSESFIDHIILGDAARDWLVPDSLRVLSYRETGAEWKERLSDHCPVSVRLRPPD